MSVRSEVSRLESAKSAIADAITAKGVAVPASAKLDSYAGLVAEIQAGGGGSSDFHPWESNINAIRDSGVYYFPVDAPSDMPSNMSDVLVLIASKLDTSLISIAAFGVNNDGYGQYRMGWINVDGDSATIDWRFDYDLKTFATTDYVEQLIGGIENGSY